MLKILNIGWWHIYPWCVQDRCVNSSYCLNLFYWFSSSIPISTLSMSNSDELQIPYPLAGAFAMNKEREAKRERKGNGSISSCTKIRKWDLFFELSFQCHPERLSSWYQVALLVNIQREHAMLVPRVGTGLPIFVHHEVNRASHESSQTFDSPAL